MNENPLDLVPDTAKELGAGILLAGTFVFLINIFGNTVNTAPAYLQFALTLLLITGITYGITRRLESWKILIGVIFTTLAIDIVMPPYFVDLGGNLAQANATYLTGTATDYVIGNTLYNAGIHGPPLFFAVYFGGFAILYILAYIFIKLETESNTGGT